MKASWHSPGKPVAKANQLYSALSLCCNTSCSHFENHPESTFTPLLIWQTCWIFISMKERSHQIPKQPTVDEGIPKWKCMTLIINTRALINSFRRTKRGKPGLSIRTDYSQLESKMTVDEKPWKYSCQVWGEKCIYTTQVRLFSLGPPIWFEYQFLTSKGSLHDLV